MQESIPPGIKGQLHKILLASLNSWRGLRTGFKAERAIRQELIILALAVPSALVLSANLWTRIALVGVVLIVLAIEFLNTAIERLCDHVTPNFHETIGIIKDYGSAAVFCTLILVLLVWGAALLERIGALGG